MFLITNLIPTDGSMSISFLRLKNWWYKDNVDQQGLRDISNTDAVKVYIEDTLHYKIQLLYTGQPAQCTSSLQQVGL